MKPIFFLSIFLNTEYWTLNTAMAKDFGIHGHVFEIGEPDLLKQMEGKLKKWETEGKLSELNETLIKRTQKSLSEPRPVEGLTKATVARIFEYDPSITVPYDLKDHEGRVFHRAGTKINPLAYRSLTQPLVFLDGTDKAQVLWVEKTYLQTNQSSKIILTSGSPFQLMEKWQAQAVYFDQGGVLTRKLGIYHIPAVVVQDGLKLKVSEIVVEEVLEEDSQ